MTAILGRFPDFLFITQTVYTHSAQKCTIIVAIFGIDRIVYNVVCVFVLVFDMTVIKRSAKVPFTPAQMFALVNEVEKYPEFLPWCDSSNVLSRNEDEVRATLCLAKGKLKKSFTTCNRMQKDKMVEVKLVSGPFKHLEGFWRFEALDDGNCRVSLDLEFEFLNKLISLALGPIFNQVANTLVDHFIKRAEDIYRQPV